MNPLTQPDLHPDAETLSAFAEQQFTAPERDQTLAHLATCDHCRQILYLVKHAEQAEETWQAQTAIPLKPHLVPAHRSARRFASLLTNWQLPTLAAAACLALAATSLWLYPHIHPNQQQLDARKSPQQPAALSQPTAPNPEPQLAARSKFKAKSQPAPSPSNLKAPKPPVPGPPRPSTAPPTPNSPGTSFGMAQSPVALPPSAAPIPYLAPNLALQPLGQVAPRPAAQQAPLPSESQSAEAQSSAIESAGVQSAAIQSSSARTAQAQSAQAQSAAISSFNSSPLRKAATAAAKTLQTPLPNGQKALATAANANLILAIDSTGALQLSKDTGKTWQPIPAQWTGRLVSLRIALTNPASTNPASTNPASTNPASTNPASNDPAPATTNGNTPANQPAQQQVPYFEIETDHHALYRSTDGLTWTPYPNPAEKHE
jgi:hypothetical protein